MCASKTKCWVGDHDLEEGKKHMVCLATESDTRTGLVPCSTEANSIDCSVP